MSYNATAVTSRTLALWAIEARLMYGVADERGDTEMEDRVFAEFNQRVESMGAQDLRDLVETLSDIAWDLADTWARTSGSHTVPLHNIRSGRARGW